MQLFRKRIYRISRFLFLLRMKIRIITIAKNQDVNTATLFNEYLKRLNHYTPVEEIFLKASSQKDELIHRREEAASVLKRIVSDEIMILLDEGGKELTSIAFASWLEMKLNAGRNLCFIIGGAYGFDEALRKKSNSAISLSKMTLPHQLAKVVFAEQLYRAFTILRNEKYHH